MADLKLPEIKRPQAPQAGLSLPVPVRPQLPPLNPPTFESLRSRNVSYYKQKKFEQYQAERKAEQDAYEAEIEAARLKAEEEMAHLADYNSTGELNSFADIIYDSQMYRINMGLSPSKYNFVDFALSNITSSIRAASNIKDLIEKYTYKPLAKSVEAAGNKDWPEMKKQMMVFGMNQLQNFAETADLIVNPIKAVAIGAVDKDQTVLGNLKASVGWDTVGRENFDYNVKIDNMPLKFIAEFGLEFVSDPLNWLTLGTKGIATLVAKRGLKESVTGITDTSAGMVARRFSREIAGGATTDDATKAALSAAQARIKRTVTKHLKSNNVPIDKLVAKYGDDFLGNLTPEMVRKGIMENNAYQVGKTISAVRTAEELDKQLMRVAFFSSGGLAPYAMFNLLKAPSGRAFNSLLERTQDAWKVYAKPGTDEINITQFDSASKNYIDNLRITQLVDYIDDHNMPPGVVDIRFGDTIRKEADNIMSIVEKNVNTKDLDPVDITLLLDDYAKNLNPDFTEFKDYVKYIKKLSDKGTAYSDLKILESAVDVVNSTYELTKEYKHKDFVMNTVEGFRKQTDTAIGSIEDRASFYNMSDKKIIKWSERTYEDLDNQTDTLMEEYDYLVRNGLDVSNIEKELDDIDAKTKMFEEAMKNKSIGRLQDFLGITTDSNTTVLLEANKILSELQTIGKSTDAFDGITSELKDIVDSIQSKVEYVTDPMTGVRSIKFNAPIGYEVMALIGNGNAGIDIIKIAKEMLNYTDSQWLNSVQKDINKLITRLNVFRNIYSNDEIVYKIDRAINVLENTDNPRVIMKTVSELVSDDDFALTGIFPRLRELQDVMIERVTKQDLTTKDEVLEWIANPNKNRLDELEAEGFITNKYNTTKLEFDLFDLNRYFMQPNNKFQTKLESILDVYTNTKAERITPEIFEAYERIQHLLRKVYSEESDSFTKRVDFSKYGRGIKLSEVKPNTPDPDDIKLLGDALEDMKDVLNRKRLATLHAIEDSQKTDDESINAMINTLDSIYDDIDELYTKTFLEPMVSTAEGKTYYRLQTSLVRNTYSLLNADGLKNFLGEVVTRKGLGAVMYSMLLDDKVHADVLRHTQKLISKSEGMYHYDKFMNNILGSGLPKEIIIGILDTMQSPRMARANLETIMNKPEAYIHLIMKSAEDLVNTASSPRSLKLETLAESLGYKYSAHDALDDARANKFMAEKLLELNKLVAENETLVYFDIETTGLNKQGSNVFQLGYIDPETDIGYDIRTFSRDIPDFATRRKLAPAHLDTDEARIAWFKDTYQDRDKLKLEPYFDKESKKYVIYVETEADLLSKFKDFIDEMKLKDKRPIPIGHNIKDYDMNLINNRMVQHKLKPFSKSQNMIDTYQELKKLDKHYSIDDEQAKLIRTHIMNYINRRDNQSTDRWFAVNKLDGVSKQFIETPDKEFNMSLLSARSNIIYSVDDDLDKLEIAGTSDIMSDFTDRLRDLNTSIGNELSMIKDLNSAYSSSYIELTDENMMKMRGANDLPWNVTQAVYELALKDNQFASMGYKTISKNDLVKSWYHIDTLGKEIPASQAIRYQESAKELNRIRMLVDNRSLTNLIDPQMRRFITEMQAQFLKVRERRMGPMVTAMLGDDANTIYSILDDAVLSLELDDIMSSDMVYSVANRLSHMYERIITLSQGLVNKDIKLPEFETDIYKYISDIEQVKFKNTNDSAMFVTPTVLEDSVIDDAYKMHSELLTIEDSFDNFKDKMDKVAEIHDKYTINGADARLKASMVSELAESFVHLRTVVDDLIATHGYGLEFKKHYDNILNEFKHYQNALGKNSLHLALDRNPEELLSYLYHDSFGILTFKFKDLEKIPQNMAEFTSNKNVAGIGADAYDAIKSNQSEYEALGIRFYEESDRAWIYLDKNKLTKDVIYKADKRDISVLPLGDDPLGGRFHQDVIKSKSALDFHSSDLSKNTAGEVFEKKNYSDIYDAAPPDVQELMIPIEEWDQRHAFDGLAFNRSVLGDIDSKKELMPYLSKNILKNYSQSIQKMTTRVDSVTKYASIFTDESNTLNGYLFKGFSDEDMLSYFKNHPEYVLGRVVYNKKGIKISTKHVKTLKDIAEARANNYVITPEFAMNQAKSVINRARVSNEAFRLIDKFYVGPVKMGYLSTLGFLMRNMVDSPLKIIADEGSLDVIPFMQRTIGQYNKYKQALREILHEYGDLNTDSINLYFKQPRPSVDRELFEIIHEFTKGPSAGYSHELVKYYEDNANKLIQHSRIPRDRLSVKDVREVLENPERVKNSGRDPDVISELLRLEVESDFLDRAKNMAIHSKNNRLNVDSLLLYIKGTEDVPAELQEEYTRLLKYNKNRPVEKFFEEVVYNKATQVITNVNGYMEQVFRLTTYLYNLNKGASVDSAMHKVIKQHFDPTHKSKSERVLEMLFPFSTFTIKNMHYWLDALASKGFVGRIFNDMMTPIWDFDKDQDEEYDNPMRGLDKWDRYNRMSLQYLTMSGNIPFSDVIKSEPYLDEDGNVKEHFDGSGRTKETLIYNTIKMSPSIMDTLNLIWDPVGTVKNRLVVPLRGPLDFTIFNEDWDGDGEGDTTFGDIAVQAIPYIGPIVQRYSTGWKYYNDTTNIADLILPSVVGRSRIDSWIDEYRGNPNFDEEGNWIGPNALDEYKKRPIGFDWYNQSQAYKDTHQYRRGISYQPVDYSKYNNYALPSTISNRSPLRYNRWYQDMTYRNGEAKMTRVGRNVKYNRRDIYKDLFTTSAKSKIQLDVGPISPDNIKYRVRNLYRHL